MIDYFEDQDSFYIVMKKLERCSDLFDYLDKNGPLGERLSRVFFRQVAEAVQYLQSVGVFHRDIKVENIVLDLKEGEAKLVDFGLATHFTDEPFTEFSGKNLFLMILDCHVSRAHWLYEYIIKKKLLD